MKKIDDAGVEENMICTLRNHEMRSMTK
jgi:hypothetical protein